MNPGMLKAWFSGLYGKLALIHEDVRKVSEFAAVVPGTGAVVKVPFRLFDKAYAYIVAGRRCVKVTG